MSNTAHNSIAAERHERIRERVRLQRVVRVDELAHDLNVSSATIRRDLLELEQQGSLRRVHGGGVNVESNLDEPLFDDKADRMAAEKQRIAEAALKLVKPRDAVFLDGGSTVLALARLLIPLSGLTVVTNSMRVASLMSAGGPRLILVGGELRRVSQTFVGALTRPLLAQLHVDTAFMGTIGLSADGTLSTTDPREAQTKELAMHQARKTVLLSDSSKLGQSSFVRVGQLESIDLLITDRGAPDALLDALRRDDTEILIV